MGDDIGSPSGLSSIWQRGKEKIGLSGGKTVKFVPNTSLVGEGTKNDENVQVTEQDNLTPKQRRRAQVRKAQIEHRQRKENKVKHLEKDLIDLRESIAAATTKIILFKNENQSIRNILDQLNADYSSVTPLPQQQPDLQSDNFLWDFNALPTEHDNFFVDTIFDEFLDSSCLQISAFNDLDTLMTDNATFPLDTNMLSLDLNTPAPENISTPRVQPIVYQPQAPVMNTMSEKELSAIAINFILALEHPCRTHFHVATTKFDPKGSPSGHELMASTLLYSHAPPEIFTNPSFKKPFPKPTPKYISQPRNFSQPTQFNTPTTTASAPLSWTTPSTSPELALANLKAIASSLPKSDWELTPVQAWFLLTAHYPMQTLFSDSNSGYNTTGDGSNGTKALDRLKKELGALVKCFAFGAVIGEVAFWDVVEGVLGPASVVGEGVLN